MTEPISQWSDAPITEAAQDRYGRTEFSETAAQLINASYDPEQSVVFGLIGSWGSGKTSMIRLIESSLRKMDWSVVEFTPWATQSESQLLQEFYAAIYSAADLKGDHEKSKLKKSLGGLLRTTAPAASEALGGVALLAGIPGIQKILEGALGQAADSLLDEKPWNAKFKETAVLLKSSGRHILVVVDDIDRLQPAELHTLLKVVRLLGRFPGVTYLLAYDQATIDSALFSVGGNSDGWSARSAYMEKIVQYPLIVPTLTTRQIFNRLNDGLDSIRSGLGRQPLESARLGRLGAVFESTLHTPRSLERFLQACARNLAILDPEEVNEEDLILLTLLQTSFPSIYQELPVWKRHLLSGEEQGGGSGNVQERTKFSIKSLSSMARGGSPWQAEVILNDLFPRLGSVGPYPRSKGIGDEDYFDRYFVLGIPAEDISNRAVGAAIAAAMRGEGGALRELLSGDSLERSALAIQKAREWDMPKDADGASVLRLLTTVAPLIDLSKDSGHLFLSPRQILFYWVGALLRRACATSTTDEVESALAGSSLNVRAELCYSMLDEWPEVRALRDLGKRVAAACLEELELNLCARDAAPRGDATYLWLTYLKASAEWEGAVEMIGKDVRGGLFSLDDLAARFVSIRTVVAPGAKPEVSDFDSALFVKAISEAHLKEYQDLVLGNATNPGNEKVDRSDLSWSNRRHYARERYAPACVETAGRTLNRLQE